MKWAIFRAPDRDARICVLENIDRQKIWQGLSNSIYWMKWAIFRAPDRDARICVVENIDRCWAGTTRGNSVAT